MEEIKQYALSNDDINKILEPDTKVFAYPDFASMTHIDDAFDKLGRCIFLFLTENQSMGHWICMFKRGKNTIEYFDSYGDPPEAQRDWLSDGELQALGQGEPYLLNLLRDSGYKVFYNKYQYQKDKKDINTCGRWAVARLICKDLTNDEFYKLVKSSKMPFDDWVSSFTAEMLGK